jgi:hypothetical protein
MVGAQAPISTPYLELAFTEDPSRPKDSEFSNPQYSYVMEFVEQRSVLQNRQDARQRPILLSFFAWPVSYIDS